MRARVGGPGVDSELSASSDEADSEAVASARTSEDHEASSNNETSKEPNASSSLVDDPKGVSVSVRSTLDWEAVTTPDATFLGVALVARATRVGVAVPRGTYSGSCSSLEPINTRADGVIDIEFPHA